MSTEESKTEIQKKLESLGFKPTIKQDKPNKIEPSRTPSSSIHNSQINITNGRVVSNRESRNILINNLCSNYTFTDDALNKINRYSYNKLSTINEYLKNHNLKDKTVSNFVFKNGKVIEVREPPSKNTLHSTENNNSKKNINRENELRKKLCFNYSFTNKALNKINNCSYSELSKIIEHLRTKSLKGKNIHEIVFKNGIVQKVKVSIHSQGKTPTIKPNTDSVGIDTHKGIGLTTQSTLSHSLLSPVKTNIIVEAFTDSNRTQLNTNQDYETELVVGLDFGTANTKVVVQEQGSGNAWAIPFTNQTENPYLLPSCVYFNGSYYSLFGDEFEKHGNLKLPLILKDYNNNNLINIIAFITLVIRHAREWFLIHAADSFQEFTFEWLYNMGLPAANNDDSELIKTYRKIFIIAVKLSLLEEQLTTILIATHLKKIENTDIKSDPLFASLQTCPEIQAQLEGYVRSDRWDSQRIKFMMVDVGGGTVDASIINVTYDEVGDPRFNCLKTKVDSLGIKMLHYKRLEWLIASAKNSLFNLDELIKNLDKAKAHIDQIDIIPVKVNEYMDHTKWLHEHSIDNDFYSDFYNLVFAKIINNVKKTIDIESTQWKSLQFIFCGGGSLHPLYKKITEQDELDILPLLKPKKLIAPKITDNEYHRLSVAYGLSFSDLGSFINPSEIDPMLDPDNPEDPQSTYRDRYIEQP